MKTRALSALAAAVASVVLLGGCSASTAPQTSPPFGATVLAAPTKKYVIATVGDSHALRFAQGMEQVAGDAYQVVRAAYGGCGLMRESRYKLSSYGLSDEHAANRACDDWDSEWRQLIEQSKPDAVLLTTSYWDVNAQKIDDTDTFRLITDKKFRDQYAASLQEGIDILSAQGARVYLDNSLPYLGNDMPSAEAMSKTVTEVYRKAKAAGKNVGLLDLRGQLCDGNTCPTTIDGIAVMDETSHPAGESLARQSRWILNTISADLGAVQR
ncbi:DUF459 domain-containing protein [Leifsonia sp. RAF41]|uniref:DUF459 domain-containing protein n=1 Tax=Leifsonia sp. RAF41 TaxID=3233056 RepID=UPI003F9929E7